MPHITYLWSERHLKKPPKHLFSPLKVENQKAIVPFGKHPKGMFKKPL